MNLQVTGQLTGIEARNGGWFAVAIQEPGRDWPLKVSTKRTTLVQEAQALMGQNVSAVYTEQESTNINPNSGQPYINRYLEGVSLAGQPPQEPAQQQQYSQQVLQPQHSQPVQQSGQYPYPMPPPVQPVQQPIQVQQSPQGGLPQPGTTQTMTHVVRDDSLRELKIHRQSAAKVAVQLLPLIPLREGEEHNLTGLLKLSEALVRYFDEGVQWKVEQPSAGANPGAAVQSDGQPGGSYGAGDLGPQPGDPGPSDAAIGGASVPVDDGIPFAPSIY